jgi:hypothetical protein
MQIDTELEQIIKTDYQKHHQGRDYTVDTVLEVWSNMEKANYFFRVYGPVAIVHKPYSEDTVEFHCTNSGSAEDLVRAVNEFNKEMSVRYVHSVTFYDNPKINELLKYAQCPNEFAKIDRGIDKTYEAKFRLRGI